VNGCISADPLFSAAETNDFRLHKTSPCKDAGLNLLGWMPGAVDLAGNPRILGSIADIGAYETRAGGGTIFTLY